MSKRLLHPNVGIPKWGPLALTRVVEVVVRHVLQLLVREALVEGVLQTQKAQLHVFRLPWALVPAPLRTRYTVLEWETAVVVASSPIAFFLPWRILARGNTGVSLWS